MLFRGIPAGPCPVLVAVASGLSEPCLAVLRVGCRAFFTGVGCRSRCCRRAFRVYKDTGIPLYSLHVGADFFAFLPGGSRGCAPGSTPVPAAGHRIAPSGAQVCSRAGKGVLGRRVSGLSAPSVRAQSRTPFFCRSLFILFTVPDLPICCHSAWSLYCFLGIVTLFCGLYLCAV